MQARILCLDRSASIRNLLAELVRRRGWTPIVGDGLASLAAALGGEPVDLVLSAARFTRDDDYLCVVEALRRCPETALVPVVLLVADESDTLAKEALRAGTTEVFRRHDVDGLERYFDAFAREKTSGAPVGGRALVLDDDTAVAAYMARILEGLGMAVDCAGSLDDALESVLVTAYDLLVVDIVLGESQSGNQLVRLLRQSIGHALATPIIVVSGFHDEARKLDALRAGASVYLPKPVKPDELAFFAQKLLLRTGSGETPNPVDGQAANPLGFSRREAMIAELVAAGLPDKNIAERLGISFWTVRSHLTNMFRKCGAINRVELALLLRRSATGGGARAAAKAEMPPFSPPMLDQLQIGVFVVDRNRLIVYANPAVAEVTGYSCEELLGRSPRIFDSGRHSPDFFRAMQRDLETAQSWSGEIWNRRKSGEVYPAWLDIRLLGDADAPYYMAVLSDETERLREKERGDATAMADDLTGLPNRRLLFDRAQQEIARAKRHGGGFAVLVIELDCYQEAARRLGRAVADRFLKHLAGMLRTRLRESDTLARVGGGEFVALLPDLKERSAGEALAEGLATLLDQPLACEGQPITPGARVGVSFFPDQGSDLEELIAHAGRAVRRATPADGRPAGAGAAGQGVEGAPADAEGNKTAVPGPQGG